MITTPRIEAITPADLDAAIGIRVHPDQEHRVAPVVRSLAEGPCGGASPAAAGGSATRGPPVLKGGQTMPRIRPRSRRSWGRRWSCSAVRGASSGGRLRIAAASSGAITEK